MDIKQILEQAGKDILTEETLNSIQESVKKYVEKSVNEKVELAVESALEKQDLEYGQKAARMIRAIDEDHTKKMDRLVKAIEEKRTQQLKQVVEKFNKGIYKRADGLREELVESISNFLDVYVEKKLPRKQIREAAEAKYAEKVLKEAREILGVDDRLVDENFRSAVKDGHQQIQKLQQENAKLKKQKAIFEAKRLLAEQTANMPKQMAEFVKKRFVNKSPEYIKENLQYVVKLFKDGEKEQKLSVVSESRLRKPVVDLEGVLNENTHDVRDNKVIIEEDVHPMISSYLEGLGANRD